MSGAAQLASVLVAFERRYGRNPDLADDLIKEMVVDLLRADHGIVESYAPTAGKEPLPLVPSYP